MSEKEREKERERDSEKEREKEREHAALIPGERSINGFNWANFKLSQKQFLER